MVNALHINLFVLIFFWSIVKLPELLACVNMEEEALAKLQKKLLDLLRYICFVLSEIFSY